MPTFFRISALAVAAAVGAATSPGAAATGGIAFDTVTKFAMGDQNEAVPGSFAADFAAAGSASAAGPAKRGPFGLGAAIAAASGAMSMMKTGNAEHRYIAGAKQRTDTIATGEARIVDCKARTLTTLDLKNKTYTVVSLDAPEATPEPQKRGHSSAPQPAGTDDGTRVALAMTTKTLGPKPIDGTPTVGYDAHMKMTTTRPSGETSSFDSDMTEYLSNYAEPRDGCPEVATRMGAQNRPGGDAAAMGQFALAMRAMRTPAGDPRFTVTSSGAPLPTGKLALWQRMTMGQGGGFAVLIERGNVRSISESDPIFSVPADFTKRP